MAAEGRRPQATRGRIYLMGEDGKPRAFNVRLGITDGTSTELLVGARRPDAAELKEGALVITGTVAAARRRRRARAPRRPAHAVLSRASRWHHGPD
jgi:HlyD family secretion protein